MELNWVLDNGILRSKQYWARLSCWSHRPGQVSSSILYPKILNINRIAQWAKTDKMKAPCGWRQKAIVTCTQQCNKSIEIDIDYAIPNCATSTNKTQQTVHTYTHVQPNKQSTHTTYIHVQRPHVRERARESQNVRKYVCACPCMRAWAQALCTGTTRTLTHSVI